MLTKSLAIVCLVVSLFNGALFGAKFTDQISYQGILKDSLGMPVDSGNYTIIFRIFKLPTGGSAVWQESQTVLVSNDGSFSVYLGAVNPLNDDDFYDDDPIAISTPRWLETQVEGEIISPRSLLASTPFSQVSSSVAGDAYTIEGTIYTFSTCGFPSVVSLGFDFDKASCDTTGDTLAYTVERNRSSASKKAPDQLSSYSPSLSQTVIYVPTVDTLSHWENVTSPSGNHSYSRLGDVNRYTLSVDTGTTRITLRNTSNIASTALDEAGLSMFWADGLSAVSNRRDRSLWLDDFSADTTFYLKNSQAQSALQAYFAGRVGIGTLNPQAKLHVISSELDASVVGKNSSNGAGVKCVNEGTGPAIVGTAMVGDLVQLFSTGPLNLRFSVDNLGNVCADGTISQNGGCDVAENMSVIGGVAEYEFGDVMVLSPDKVGHLELTDEPYCKRVVGVYSSKPGFHLQGNAFDHSQPQVPIALSGIVPCKVSTENGAIEIGDLLVTSWTRGYAMKATDREKCTGAIIGKAMEPLNDDKGVIRVLVFPQ